MFSKLLDLLARGLAKVYPDYCQEAYDEGHTDGVQDGFSEGWDSGEHHGYQRAQDSVADWYTRDRDH